MRFPARSTSAALGVHHVRIPDARRDPRLPRRRCDQPPAGPGPLDAVVHRVFEQRLQHHGRHERVHRAIEFQSMRSRSPRRNCSRSRYARAARSRRKPNELPRVRISTRNRSARSSSAARRSRIAAHQREHRVEAVEQEMRANARLQRLKARLGKRGRVRGPAQAKVSDQEDAPRKATGVDRRRSAHAGRIAQVSP